MPRKIFLILIALIFVFGVSKLSSAMMCHGGGSQQEIPGQEQTAQSSSEHRHQETDTATQVMPDEAVNVGNKICPVLDQKIDDKFKATYEYEGKIYNFCCAMCIDEFKKDPEKYIKKVEEELKKQAKEQKEITPTIHEGHHHH